MITNAAVSAPLVSIITPAYNAATFIGETIKSVLAQTYANWDLLVVDDGSTDATCEVVRGFADPRIRLIPIAHSGHPSVVRNIGLKHAAGRYIALLDSDDIWLPEKLRLQIEYLEQHPTVGLAFTKVVYFYPDIGRVSSQMRPDVRDLPNPGMLLRELCYRGLAYNSTVVLRRELLAANGGYDEDPQQRGTEDYELCLRLAPHTLFGFVDQPLVRYCIRSDSLSRRETHIAQGLDLALAKAFQRQPELSAELQGDRCLLALRLLRLGTARLLDGMPGRGRSEIIQSLRIWPYNRRAWGWLVLSYLRPNLVQLVRRLSHHLV